MPSGVTLEIKEIRYSSLYREPEPLAGAEDFAVRAQVLIGEVDDKRADSFDILVCSVGRLADYYSPERWEQRQDDGEVLPDGNICPVVGMWLMRSWSREQLESALRRLVAASSPGPDFQTVADRIGRLVPWEYDYLHDFRVNQGAGLPDLVEDFWDNSD